MPHPTLPSAPHHRAFVGFAYRRALLGACAVLLFVVGCSAVSNTRSSGVSATAPGAPPPSVKAEVQSPAVPPTAGSAGDAGSTSLPTATNRAVIRTGSMELVVRSVTESIESVRGVAAAAGGLVSDSSFIGAGGEQSAQLTLRIPVDRLDATVTKLQALAIEVRTSSLTSKDVTDEVTDVEATLRNLRAVEAQYTQLLSRAGTITDVLQVQDRLNQTRLQIDRTEARRQFLASQTQMATVTVALAPQGSLAPVGGGPLAAARAAWAASLRTLEVVGTAVLVTVVYLWWLWPLLAVGAWFAVRLVRREALKQAGHQTPTPPPAE